MFCTFSYYNSCNFMLLFPFYIAISCDAGYYFDLGDLTCRMCRPGTFSLGGGLLFDTWDELPEGFYTQVESFHSSFSSFGRYGSEVNCSK